MEIELAKELMQLFFHAPAANGLLVFEDNEYLGVILKRDIEIGIMEGNFNVFENINMVKTNQLTRLLFKDETNRNLKIPVIDKVGKLIRIITQEEFNCQFNLDDYIQHFKLQQVFDSMDHPLIVTNHFKKCIYANKKALELVEFDIQGKNFSTIMKLFDVKQAGKFLTLVKKDHVFHLIISHAQTKNFSYIVYQFIDG